MHNPDCFYLEGLYQLWKSQVWAVLNVSHHKAAVFGTALISSVI